MNETCTQKCPEAFGVTLLYYNYVMLQHYLLVLL